VHLRKTNPKRFKILFYFTGNVVLRRQKNRGVDKKSGLFVRASSTRLSDVDVENEAFDKMPFRHSSFHRQQKQVPVVGRKFVKFGYSQHEVWDWLHMEDINANNNAIYSTDQVKYQQLAIFFLKLYLT
jgi:hypothetical protein